MCYSVNTMRGKEEMVLNMRKLHQEWIIIKYDKHLYYI